MSSRHANFPSHALAAPASTEAGGEATIGSALKLDRFVCFSIYAANNAVGRLYKPLLDRLGLTYPQYLVMVVLWERDDRTVGELGEALSLESNTLSPLLKRMEAAGLVSRSRDPGDERQVRLRLTEAGRRLRSEAEAIPACVLKATGMDLPSLERLVDELARLRAALTAA